MTHPADEDRESMIAVIGMACRFPGAGSIERFWENLCEGRESTTFFTDEELLAAGVDPALLGDPRYVKAGQILPDVELFDAGYFGIPDGEAELIDPQQRHFLECAHEALERSGHLPGGAQATIGVYAGAGLNTYLLDNLAGRYRTGSTQERYRLMLCNDKDFLATRVSYRLDLHGPSVGVNTACSTSLVAVHLACLSLLAGECDIALAGGAHIKLPQVEGYLFQDGMILSPDGHCRALDPMARGTVVGDGVGVVVLRRLADAVRDGDHIHAVIRGTAVNNDGGAKAGYTAPSVQGQADVLAEALHVAGCAADTISYVEAHGTGTVLGDAVELAALTQVFGERAEPCAIGSVKSNIGHLDCASGVAGLIKTALMLEHGQLVASLHVAEPDSVIGPFRVSTGREEWPTGDGPRRAGVSSFGVGGTNAHVVLEEAPAPKPAAAPDGSQLLVLSARSAAALEKLTDDLARRLHDQHATLDLADVAYTLATGRRAHTYRRAVVCRDTRDAAVTLALREPGRVHDAEAPAGDTLAVAAGDVPAVADGDTPAAGGVPAGLSDGVPAVADGGVPAGPSDRPPHPAVETRPESREAWLESREAWLDAVGRSWIRGDAVDWAAFLTGRRVPLPPCPFEHRRHWVDPARTDPGAPAPLDESLRRQVDEADDGGKVEIVQAFLQGEVAKILGLGSADRVDLDEDLFGLGIGSLELIEIAARLGERLQVRVPVSLFVDRPTIRIYAENVVFLSPAETAATAGVSEDISGDASAGVSKDISRDVSAGVSAGEASSAARGPGGDDPHPPLPPP
ncbi:beta-ketoacyl synthase N-terminal-like domain-containing protein [Streptosporangium sp. G11]|uniref:beta-ketoacyl synthase N-terminal-like domain-containing protein n=1 Tax=Streptosporangium sp. G11 TaxID=3436926 RepID=UPI003EB80691